jgi:hypothetical protein
MLPEAQNWVIGSPAVTAVFATRQLAPEHTLAAVINFEVASSDKDAFVYLTQSEKILRDITGSIRENMIAGGIRLSSFDSLPTKWKANQCFDYRAVVEMDGQPGRLSGRTCVLTDRDGLFLVLLNLEYSERRRVSDKEYQHFDDEAREFLDGITVLR